jgi:hypothetical protein
MGYLIVIIVLVVAAYVALRMMRSNTDRQIGPAIESIQPANGRTFRLGVAGESHKNTDGSSRQTIIRKCQSGEPVMLVPEPTNPHDSDAVKVCRRSGEQIGYLPRYHRLLPAIKRGDVSAVIDSITGGSRDKPSRGVVLSLTVRK